MIASSRQPSLARDQSDQRQDDEMHDEELRELASMEQHAKLEHNANASQKESRGNNAKGVPTTSFDVMADAGLSTSFFPSTSSLFPPTPAQRPVPATQTRSRSPKLMLLTFATVLRHAPQGVPEQDNNPFSTGRFFEAFQASSQPPALPNDLPSGLCSSSSSFSALLRNPA
jgi:hypothetical protein